VHLTIEA
jgi:hypothetical protein